MAEAWFLPKSDCIAFRVQGQLKVEGTDRSTDRQESSSLSQTSADRTVQPQIGKNRGPLSLTTITILSTHASRVSV